MNIGVIINDFQTLETTQTTWMLAQELVLRGHDVWLYPAWQLGMAPDGRVTGRRALLTVDDPRLLRLSESAPRSLDDLSLVLVRTNPARDPRPAIGETTLLLLTRLADSGVPVVNYPRGLWKASSKLYLAELDSDLRPPTLVTSEFGEARAFVASEGKCVLKPLVGTRGQDVFVVDGPDASNLRQIFEVVSRSGPVMVQRFVPEALDGDIRVVLLDGRPLTVDGSVCAVRRIPGAGDFRSNIHVGGKAVAADLTERQLTIARRVGAQLKRDGVSLAGIDLIGHQIIEVNVFSTGGYRDAEKFTGADFRGATIDWLERQLRR
jgi:glutathione synthase